MNLRESGDFRSQGQYLLQLDGQHFNVFCCEADGINRLSPMSPVAIYLGIKKRPSPGPSDMAGI